MPELLDLRRQFVNLLLQIAGGLSKSGGGSVVVDHGEGAIIDPGGNLAFNTFAELGAEDSPDADRIMHGILETNAGYTIMANDVASDIEYRPMAGFSVSLSGDDADLLRGYWEKLSAGGTITMPMQKQV